MQTAVSHVQHFFSPTFSASEPDNPNHEEDTVLQRSLKLGVADGLAAVTWQAWFPVLDAKDDNLEWPRND